MNCASARLALLNIKYRSLGYAESKIPLGIAITPEG
jgi:hypothetical protein